jgi:hypothetical protein
MIIINIHLNSEKKNQTIHCFSKGKKREEKKKEKF